MNVLLLTIGSHGDVHPFIGLGLALRARGHDVTFCTNDYFKPLAERAGFSNFIPLGTAEDYCSMARRPELWDHKRGVRLIFEFIGRGLSDVFDITSDHHARYGTDGIVVSSSLALGARVAQDVHHFPMATVHLAPTILRSVINPARLPGLFMPPWLPRWMKRALWSLVDRIGIDPIVSPVLNEFRASKQLPPIEHPLRDWWHSPDRVLGFWPDWFGPVQADWRPQVRLCGFPLYDETGLEALSAEVDDFLDGGQPPIAFTPGSAMWRGDDFFHAAVFACRQLGRRGILLSRHVDHIPKDLPDTVVHVPFAPFSQLLPRVAALVHHGGIGTTSQALRAGIPQQIVAMSHDQPDNGHRVRKLGVGAVTTPRQFNSGRSIGELRRLLLDPSVAEHCGEIRRRFDGQTPLMDACNDVESLGSRARQLMDSA